MKNKNHLSPPEKPRPRKLYKKIGAAALLVGLMGSGGAADKLADPFSSPSHVIDKAAADSVDALPDPDDTLDGIKFSEFPIDYQEELRQEIAQEKVELGAASERLSGIMENLDNHSNDEIHRKADEFLQSNRTEYAYQIDNKDSTIQKISESAEVGNVINLTNIYMQNSYGVNFSLATDDNQVKYVGAIDAKDVDIDTLKETATSVINTFFVYPKSLIGYADLKEVLVGSSKSLSVAGEYTANQYSKDTGRVSIPLNGAIKDGLGKISGFLAGGYDLNLNSIIAHEIGHAIASTNDADVRKKLNLALPGYGYESIDFQEYIKFYFGRAVNYQLSTSLYGVSDISEESAETVSATMSNRKDGIAHPDEVRRFNSPANKENLKFLLGLERMYPGGGRSKWTYG